MATDSLASPVFTRPTYSSIVFGGSPAAVTRLGRSISLGTPRILVAPGSAERGGYRRG